MEASWRKREGLRVWGQGVPSTPRLPTEPEPRHASLGPHSEGWAHFISSQLLQDTGREQVFPPRVPWPRRAHKDMEGGAVVGERGSFLSQEGEREMSE